MSRHFGGECCHYDEGYDDGYDDGKDDRSFQRNDVVEALRLLSRERLLAGRHAEADLFSQAADEVERDTRIDDRVKRERDRLDTVAKLYALERTAA